MKKKKIRLLHKVVTSSVYLRSKQLCLLFNLFVWIELTSLRWRLYAFKRYGKEIYKWICVLIAFLIVYFTIVSATQLS